MGPGSRVVLKDKAGTKGSFVMGCGDTRQQPTSLERNVTPNLNGWKFVTCPLSISPFFPFFPHLYEWICIQHKRQHQPPATSPASSMVLIEVNNDSGSDSSMGFPMPVADLMAAL